MKSCRGPRLGEGARERFTKSTHLKSVPNSSRDRRLDLEAYRHQADTAHTTVKAIFSPGKSNWRAPFSLGGGDLDAQV